MNERLASWRDKLHLARLARAQIALAHQLIRKVGRFRDQVFDGDAECLRDGDPLRHIEPSLLGFELR